MQGCTLSILCFWFLGALPLSAVNRQTSGFLNESIRVNGNNRTYRLFVPSDLPDPVPLVFVFHGTEKPDHGMIRSSKSLTLKRSAKSITL
jgi:poly(3-hydroxybutyrate) depolymerase